MVQLTTVAVINVITSLTAGGARSLTQCSRVPRWTGARRSTADAAILTFAHCYIHTKKKEKKKRDECGKTSARMLTCAARSLVHQTRTAVTAARITPHRAAILAGEVAEDWMCEGEAG